MKEVEGARMSIDEPKPERAFHPLFTVTKHILPNDAT